MATKGDVVRSYYLTITETLLDDVLTNCGFCGKAYTLVEGVFQYYGITIVELSAYGEICITVSSDNCVLDRIGLVEEYIKTVTFWGEVQAVEQLYDQWITPYKSANGILYEKNLSDGERKTYKKMGRVSQYLIKRVCRKIDKQCIKGYL